MTDEKNREGWDVLADRYQTERGWPKDDLAWGHRVTPESKLKILGDPKGKRAVVLGCGGGQDVVALSRLGVSSIIAVDASPKMLAHARPLCERENVNVKFIEGTVSDLSIIESESIDLVVSVHALTYVKDIDACFREARRVLVPKGILAFSVHHPMDASTMFAGPPWTFTKSYFQVETDWAWSSLGGEKAPFTSYHHTVSDWFRIVRDAGFTIEELLEPRPSDDVLWGGDDYQKKLEMIPGTLIVRARA